MTEFASPGEPQKTVEQEVKSVTSERREKSAALKKEGATLSEAVTSFDNDYSVLDKLFKQKTGVDLISDPFESMAHPIPITKKCSIVIPAYNSGSQLTKTLQAIQASSFNAKYPQQIEVIIVDDGSPKIDVATQIKATNLDDLNVKVFRESNGRENKARYSGVIHASGDIVLFTAQDTVYSSTMIEEYMKRHEVLDDITCFGFRENIDGQDPRLETQQVRTGSLGSLPYNFNRDGRVAKEGMVDSDWLKKGGNNSSLPIDVEDDSWQWNLPGVAWGFTVSAPREVLLKTVSSYDERYKGFGGDDEHMVADLIAEGLFVIPNTGGIAFHQVHGSRWDQEEADINKRVFDEYKKSPLRRQDPTQPLLTDAVLQYELNNARTTPKEPLGLPRIDAYERGKTLLKLGLYAKALDVFNQVNDHSDIWFYHDKAVAMTLDGSEKNVNEAVELLKKAIAREPGNPNLQATLALALGRAGRYEECLAAYQTVLSLDPENPDADLVNIGDLEPVAKIELNQELGQKNLRRGKYIQCLKYYEAAIALAGKDQMPWSLFDKGVALSKLGHLDEAIKVVEECARILPNNTWISSRIGLFYEEKGDPQVAIKYYQAALEQDPANEEAVSALKRLKDSTV